MKTAFAFCLMVAAGVLLSGCATSQKGLVLDTVGPAPGNAVVGNATQGTLIVFSAFESSASFNERDAERPECSDYKILTPDGALLQRVHNVMNNVFQSPLPVRLAPGEYRVIARANGYGAITVPVVVQAGQDTVLHLEGGGSWPVWEGFTETNTSRLPDGRIVGWKGNL